MPSRQCALSLPNGKGGFGRLGGEISNGISNAQRGETHLHCAHVAYETTRDVVG